MNTDRYLTHHVPTSPKFTTKAGYLTPYALACGYLERHETMSTTTELDMPSPSTGFYRVRSWDTTEGHRELTYRTFQTLNAARRFYDHQIKAHHVST